MPFPYALPLGVAAFDPATSALIARMSPSPSYARKVLINQTITALKRYGIWSKLDVLHVYAAHSQNPALLNWISTSYTATNNSATFTTDRGFTGDAATAYISMSYAAGTGQFAQNDHCFGAWARTAGGSNTSIMGAGNVLGNSMDIKFGGAQLMFRDATFANTNSFTATNTGHIAQSRTASGTFDTYRAGSLLGSPSRSVTNPTGNFTVLAMNLDSSPAAFTGGQIGAAHLGKGLTATEIANLATILQTYMTGVGA